MTSQNSLVRSPSAALYVADAHARNSLQIAFFAHTVRTKANSIRFAHQSLCSPTIKTLHNAIKWGYLKGCPNLTAHGVKKNLNPSPATTKGNMKRPHQGIRNNPSHSHRQSEPCRHRHLPPPMLATTVLAQTTPTMTPSTLL
jgi:hypothetical protein